MTNDPSHDAEDTPTTRSKLLPTDPLVVIGWREWVGLPELKVRHVKAKIDTGARSSSLHAFDVETYFDGDIERVRFSIHPVQKRDDVHVEADVPILERRHVRSSNGETSERIVIRTSLEILRRRIMVDLTLANRDSMGFRMLVGREAIRNRFLVDSAASFLAGRRKRKRPAGSNMQTPHDLPPS
ncbi:RimK/LysX family protein [Rhodopirellula sp. JC740]|uniref:RimK/LysX family protein n=1 Tax=Rhodopirellula halodulae TaxID=2894198 RepID=A0ABS8NMW7_9BACT|nr:RimK/LysX family protein [Rhodopirellula sp. JC740]MCC9644850.1 RimK/LysX family protein [Rhodopirellula sp. JC740]